MLIGRCSRSGRHAGPLRRCHLRAGDRTGLDHAWRDHDANDVKSRGLKARSRATSLPDFPCPGPAWSRVYEPLARCSLTAFVFQQLLHTTISIHTIPTNFPPINMSAPNANTPNEGLVGQAINSVQNAANYVSETVAGKGKEASAEANKETAKGNVCFSPLLSYFSSSHANTISRLVVPSATASRLASTTSVTRPTRRSTRPRLPPTRTPSKRIRASRLCFLLLGNTRWSLFLASANHHQK